MACACARWEGGLWLTVPPGETYTVLLENVEPAPLHLRVRTASGISNLQGKTPPIGNRDHQSEFHLG